MTFKICVGVLATSTKIAAVTKDGKKDVNIFLSRTAKLILTKLNRSVANKEPFQNYVRCAARKSKMVVIC